MQRAMFESLWMATSEFVETIGKMLGIGGKFPRLEDWFAFRISHAA